MRLIASDDVLRKILEVRNQVSLDRSVLIAITGIDACGKGHIAAQWRDRLREQRLRVGLIGVDGWLNLPAKRFGGADPAEHYYLHAIRFDEMFDELVLPLRDRRSISLEADFVQETAAVYRRELYEFHDVDIVLLEGIYLLKQCFLAHYDASFWIESSFETALERAIQRAQEGLTPDQTVQAYRRIYFPAQEIHLLRDDPRNAATGIVMND